MPGMTPPPDFPLPNTLKEGDKDEYLGKTVSFLIRRNREYIVYLDEDFCIEWRTLPLRMPPPDPRPVPTQTELEIKQRSSELRARCLNWEGILDTMDGGPERKNDEKQNKLGHLLEKRTTKRWIRERETFLPFRRQLAVIVAETLGVGGPDVAQKLLVEVEERIKRRAATRARMWLLSTAFASASIIAVVLTVIACIYAFMDLDHRHFHLLILVVCCLMGGLGAAVSIMTRSSQLEIDFSAGIYVHRQEALARLLTGVFGGLVTFLLVRSGLFFAHLTGDNSTANLAILILPATVSGTSERLVTSFLSKVEDKANNPISAAKPAPGG